MIKVRKKGYLGYCILNMNITSYFVLVTINSGKLNVLIKSLITFEKLIFILFDNVITF